MLAKIGAGTLDARLEAMKKKLQGQAQQLRDSGVMELDSHDW